MDIRIEIVDPAAFAEQASSILVAAWAPPCLRYSPEYLAWQFRFPGHLPNRAAMAFLDNQTAGFVAVTPRRLAYAGTPFWAYVLSFVAVHPVARGRRIASMLYANLLDSIPVDIPIIAFAEPESIGERLLIRAFGDHAFRRHGLRSCRAVGCLPRTRTRVEATGELTSIEDSVHFTSGILTASNVDTIWNSPTPEQLEHYLADPRTRTMCAIRSLSGDAIGSAMVVNAEIISAQGMQHLPMLESVCLVKPTGDALGAAFNFAADAFPSGSIVVASNLSYLDDVLIRAAGARALPSLFSAHLFVRGGRGVLEGASSLNLEVI